MNQNIVEATVVVDALLSSSLQFEEQSSLLNSTSVALMSCLEMIPQSDFVQADTNSTTVEHFLPQLTPKPIHSDTSLISSSNIKLAVSNVQSGPRR